MPQPQHGSWLLLLLQLQPTPFHVGNTIFDFW